MAPLPKPINHLVTAIYDALAVQRNAGKAGYEGLGISISTLGEECDRALWYAFRWASKPEVVDGRKAITFETGEIEEERLLNSLEAVDGVEVIRVDPSTGKQFRYSAVHGHVRGKGDGKTVGIPEAPKTWHVVECKSAKAEYWRKIVKVGVKEGYFTHYVQAVTYAYLDGLDRALYMVRNKDTGEIHTERLKVDPEEVMRWLARAERIVFATEPPAKLHEDPSKKLAFKCTTMCRHLGVCHEGLFPRVSCRTCIHSSAQPHGDAEWSCARWGKPLSRDEQRAACPAHLFRPDLVPGDVADVDEDAETISYVLRDGATWIDGGGEKPAGDLGA